MSYLEWVQNLQSNPDPRTASNPAAGPHGDGLRPGERHAGPQGVSLRQPPTPSGSDGSPRPQLSPLARFYPPTDVALQSTPADRPGAQ
ncbi:hypothetical protein HBB16_10715 [Pseudonocardia sp. MCCB 268]|nr:hypothetical protein [Pseudonocardia cytotoxica]